MRQCICKSRLFSELVVMSSNPACNTLLKKVLNSSTEWYFVSNAHSFLQQNQNVKPLNYDIFSWLNESSFTDVFVVALVFHIGPKQSAVIMQHHSALT